jgi:hypothetical protein
MDASNVIMYATIPMFSKTSKGAQYLTANFGKLPNFSDILLDLTFKNTCSPTLILYVFFFYRHNSFSYLVQISNSS